MESEKLQASHKPPLDTVEPEGESEHSLVDITHPGSQDGSDQESEVGNPQDTDDETDTGSQEEGFTGASGEKQPSSGDHQTTSEQSSHLPGGNLKPPTQTSIPPVSTLSPFPFVPSFFGT